MDSKEAKSNLINSTKNHRKTRQTEFTPDIALTTVETKISRNVNLSPKSLAWKPPVFDEDDDAMPKQLIPAAFWEMPYDYFLWKTGASDDFYRALGRVYRLKTWDRSPVFFFKERTVASCGSRLGDRPNHHKKNDVGLHGGKDHDENHQNEGGITQ